MGKKNTDQPSPPLPHCLGISFSILLYIVRNIPDVSIFSHPLPTILRLLHS